MARDQSDHARRPDVIGQIVRIVRSLSFSITEVQAIWAEKLGLTVPQWNILNIIADAHEQGGLSVKAVAEALRVNPSFIVHQSRPLEDLGFIRRQGSSTDKRVVYLATTPKALKELQSFKESRGAVTAAITKEMGEAATLHTVELLQQLDRCFERCRRRLQIEE